MYYLRDLVENQIDKLHQASNDSWNKRARQAGNGDGKPRLHPSSVAGCTRAAILTAVHPFPDHPLWVEHTNPFGLYTKSVMLSGQVWELEISRMLDAEIGESFTASTRRWNKYWAWELDAQIIAPDEKFPLGLIIELKDTAEYNFKIRSRLPYRHHAVQLSVYQELMGNNTPARLYYNGRGHWAEYDIWHSNGYIYCEGQRDGHLSENSFEYDVPARMQELEAWLDSGELPPTEETPFERSFGCVRGSIKKGYFPNCQWYQYCWPEMPQEGPFPANAFMNKKSW